MNNVRAVKLNKLPSGKQMWRYLVHYRCTNTMSRNFDSVEGSVVVISDKPGNACNHLMDSESWPAPVEIWTYGPRGGKTSRFAGWETITAMAIMNRDRTNDGQETMEIDNA